MAQGSFKNSIGFLLQFAALVFLPMLIFWQLDFGFQLIWMPALTTLSVVVFIIGHLLRDKNT